MLKLFKNKFTTNHVLTGIIVIFLIVLFFLAIQLQDLNKELNKKKPISNKELQANYERLVHIYEKNKKINQK